MRKFLLACFVIVACALASISASESAELPEISTWQNGELRITKLETVSGNRGSWQEREYRTDLGTLMRAVWIEGAGEKGWTPPDGEISADDRPIGSGAAYRTLSINGEKALLEHHPVTGYSVAVKIEKMGTLTVESKYAEEYEIIAAADVLIQVMAANREDSK